MKGKIAYIPQARTIEFHEFDLPEVEPGAILAQVTRTNICGSEVHMWRGEFGKRGVMPGHEMVGRVYKLGKGVTTDTADAARIQVFLASLQESPVSASLKTQVANQWEIAEKKEASVPRIVIQLAERGLQLISSYLAPPLLNVQEVFVSQPAYRRGKYSSALTLRLQTGETEMNVLATPENEGVTVLLTLLGSKRQALADHRIFIRQHGRAIFSAQTDQHGVLHVPRLEPGEYEVSCHEIDTTFQLELRTQG
jgi:hypothetical protein